MKYIFSFIFLLFFNNLIVVGQEINEETKQRVSQWGYGVYSSINQNEFNRWSNGFFISKNKFRASILLDISRFYSSHNEPFSICGGRIQLDYSILNKRRFSPYLGINLHHGVYSTGPGQISSINFYDPNRKQCHDVYVLGANAFGGLEIRIFKGISIISAIGTGLHFREFENRVTSNDMTCGDQESDYVSDIFLELGITFDLSQIRHKYFGKND